MADRHSSFCVEGFFCTVYGWRSASCCQHGARPSLLDRQQHTLIGARLHSHRPITRLCLSEDRGDERSSRPNQRLCVVCRCRRLVVRSDFSASGFDSKPGARGNRGVQARQVSPRTCVRPSRHPCRFQTAVVY